MSRANLPHCAQDDRLHLLTPRLRVGIKVLVNDGADLSRVGMHCSNTTPQFLDFRVWRTKDGSVGKAVQHADDVGGTHRLASTSKGFARKKPVVDIGRRARVRDRAKCDECQGGRR